MTTQWSRRTHNFSNLRSRKVAITLGYDGSGYRGLQISYVPNVETVENCLATALGRVGAFSDSIEHVRLEKASWSRSSRTDAGVSARVLCCGAKIHVPVSLAELESAEREIERQNAASFPGKPMRGQENTAATGAHDARDGGAAKFVTLDEYIRVINEELSEIAPTKPIRIFSIVRVPKSFDAQKACSWREYAYVLPINIFDDSDDSASSSEKAGDTTSRPVCIPASVRTLNVTKLREGLQAFVGPHSYHNFCNLKRQDFVYKPVGVGAAHAPHEEGGMEGDPVCGEPVAKRQRTGDSVGAEEQEEGQKGSGKRGKRGRGRAVRWKGKKGGKGQGRVAGEDTTSMVGAVEDDSEAPSRVEVDQLMNWYHIVVKGIEASTASSGGTSNGSTREKSDATPSIRSASTNFRHRPESVLKHTKSTIYFFDVVVETESFVEIRVRGQFFLYNQIRLMIGAALAYAFGFLDRTTSGIVDGEAGAQAPGTATGGEVAEREAAAPEHADVSKENGVAVLRDALLSKMECQFPLVPGEGLALYTAGFSMMDKRTGQMALDRDQYEKCYPNAAEVFAHPERRINVTSVVVDTAHPRPEAERVFILLPSDREQADVDAFYAEHLRPKILANVRGVYKLWVKSSNVLKVGLSKEGRDELRVTAAATLAAAGGTASVAADAENHQKKSERLFEKRREALDDFLTTGRAANYSAALPRQFASDLLTAFPNDLLPGRRLTCLQIGILKRLADSSVATRSRDGSAAAAGSGGSTVVAGHASGGAGAEADVCEGRLEGRQLERLSSEDLIKLVRTLGLSTLITEGDRIVDDSE